METQEVKQQQQQQKKGTNKQNSIISLTLRLGNVAKMRVVWGKGLHILWGLTTKEILHRKKRMRNDAQQETTQTTLVDHLDFFYNQGMQCSPLYK